MTASVGQIANVVLSISLLVACVADAPPSDPASTTRERWVGYFESSLGVLGCPGRGPMTVIAENGAISGEAQAGGFDMLISGVLGPNGALRDGVFRRDAQAAAIVTGTFLEDAAAGRWQGASCEGVWALRRIRQ